MNAKELGAQPAYPTSELLGSAGEYEWQAVGGLTKREAFAMAAMQGILANPARFVHVSAEDMAAQVAKSSRLLADAMLAELVKE